MRVLQYKENEMKFNKKFRKITTIKTLTFSHSNWRATMQINVKIKEHKRVIVVCDEQNHRID